MLSCRTFPTYGWRIRWAWVRDTVKDGTPSEDTE
jgi:hypothetical protein